MEDTSQNVLPLTILAQACALATQDDEAAKSRRRLVRVKSQSQLAGPPAAEAPRLLVEALPIPTAVADPVTSTALASSTHDSTISGFAPAMIIPAVIVPTFMPTFDRPRKHHCEVCDQFFTTSRYDNLNILPRVSRGRFL